MSKPYFSIITPTYNCLDYLKKCIYSVQKQTFKSYEHIIIDDGSSDNTKEFLEGNKINNCKFIYTKHSGLPGIARNIGISNAIGKYICFLDSDDLYTKDKLDILHEEILKNQFDLIYHDEFSEHNGIKSKLEYPSPRFISRNKLIKFGNRLSTSTITIRREFLFKHNLRFSESADHRIVEDYHLWVRVLKSNPKLKKIYKFLGLYRVHSQGISSNISQLLNNERNSILDLNYSNFITNKELNFALKRLEFNSLIHNKNSFKKFIISYFKFKNFTIFSRIIIYRLLEKFNKIIRNY